MKIEKQLIKEQTLEEFADEHGFTMRINERSDEFEPHMKFWACFKGVEVKVGGFLAGVAGNGSNEHEAMMDYAHLISGKLLVFHADSPNRKEIFAPRFVKKVPTT